MHSHTYTYGDICQMFLIWQREGGLSEERMAQFAERLLGDFDLVPDEVLELMASLPASSSDGLSMPLDLGNNSVLLSEGGCRRRRYSACGCSKLGTAEF